MKTPKNQRNAADGMLLDPAFARAKAPQRKALHVIIESGMQEDAALINRVHSTIAIHRHILAQLVSSAVGRGFGIPLTGPQRSKFAEEAFAIMNASELFVKDIIAADTISPEIADEILTAYNAAQEAAEPPTEDEQPEGLRLVPDAPDLSDMSIARRVDFDAEGKIRNAPVTEGSDSGATQD